MSQFRCLGRFGPYCPTTAAFGSFVNLKLMAKALAEQLPENQKEQVFPFEIAMKMFWEAETITMEARVETTHATFGSLTSTSNRTILWGSFNDQPFANLGLANLRAKVETAAEMLCYISDEFDKLPFSTSLGPTHTTYREEINQGLLPNSLTQNWRTAERMIISPRPYMNQDDPTFRLFAPFNFSLENAGVISNPNGIYLDPFFYQSTLFIKDVGFADIITPWGNWKPRLRGGNFVTDAEMTITVTAADPVKRYGKPSLA